MGTVPLTAQLLLSPRCSSGTPPLRHPDAVLEIRRDHDDDEARVWRLHREGLVGVGADLGDGPWDDDLRAIRRVYLDSGGDFLVGVMDGEVVAIGALRPTSAQAAEIKRMRVDPNFERRGFGTALLEALEARARELGYRTLTLDTTIRQLAAQRLYESHGYAQVGRRGDAILYEKPLR